MCARCVEHKAKACWQRVGGSACVACSSHRQQCSLAQGAGGRPRKQKSAKSAVSKPKTIPATIVKDIARVDNEELAEGDGDGHNLVSTLLPTAPPKPKYIEVNTDSEGSETGSFERNIRSALDQAGDQRLQAVESLAMAVGEASATGGVGTTSEMEDREGDAM